MRLRNTPASGPAESGDDVIMSSPFQSRIMRHFHGIAATVAQAHGATLFGLATIDWFARRAEGQGLAAVLGADAATAPALVIHTGLGIGFLYFLLRTRRSSGVVTA